MMPELPGLFIFLFLMAGGQGLILSVVLWWHSHNRVQNRILGWIVCLFSLIFFYYIASNINCVVLHPWYPGYASGWMLATAAAPLLLIYLRACFGLKPWPPYAVWYWAPAAFFTLLTVGYYIAGRQVIKDYMLLGWGGILYVAAVTVYCCLLFRRYSAQSVGVQTNSSKTRRYLQWLIGFYVSYSVFQLLGFILYPHISHEASLYITVFVKLITTVGIYAIAYLNVQNAHQVAPVMIALPEEPVEKYKFSSLDEETAGYIRQRLLKLVDSDKIYLQRDLRLKEVADHIGTSVHHLSQVLNERIGLGFSDFINQLRVEEAKRILASGDDSKMETLAFDTGFNNKVSFNKAFKKFTGQTPSQYKMGQSSSSAA